MISHYDSVGQYQISGLTSLVSQTLQRVEKKGTIDEEDRLTLRHGAWLLYRIYTGSRLIEEDNPPLSLSASPVGISYYPFASKAIHTIEPDADNIYQKIKELHKTISELSYGRKEKDENILKLSRFFSELHQLFHARLQGEFYYGSNQNRSIIGRNE